MFREQNELGGAANLGSAYQFNLSSDRFVSGGHRVNEVTASLDVQEAEFSLRVDHCPGSLSWPVNCDPLHLNGRRQLCWTPFIQEHPAGYCSQVFLPHKRQDHYEED